MFTPWIWANNRFPNFEMVEASDDYEEAPLSEHVCKAIFGHKGLAEDD